MQGKDQFRGRLPAHCKVNGIFSTSQSYLVGGSSDAAVDRQYCSRLMLSRCCRVEAQV